MADTTFHSLTLPGQDTARVPSMAEEFTSETNYKVRDYCTYQGKLYRCVTNHLGNWNNSHFTETNIDIELDRKQELSKITPPENPVEGQLWVDPSVNMPVYSVDEQPILESTNVVQSGGVKTAINALDSRKIEYNVITGDFSESVDYRVGDLVFYITTINGITTRILYKCIVNHDSAPWDNTHFAAITLEKALQDLRNDRAETDMIGDLFGSKTTYVIGDYCVYNTNLYKCIRAINNSNTNAPAFNENDWEQVKLGNEIKNLQTTISNLENRILELESRL